MGVGRYKNLQLKSSDLTFSWRFHILVDRKIRKVRRMTLHVMYCSNNIGDYELWFDKDMKLLGGYFEEDAYWRDEYFNPIFEKIGIEIINIKYNRKIAVKARKEMWGF